MIPPDAEINRRPLLNNRFRKHAGLGRSQTFGIVNKRSKPPDYSSISRDRPYLYKLLLDFAESHLPGFTYNAITINQNYQCSRHKDKGNGGESLLVGWGDYEGGDVSVEMDGGTVQHDIKYQPLVLDFSKHYHWVTPFTGNRYSLVFYTCKIPQGLDLPPPSVVIVNKKHVFYRGDVPQLYDKYRSSTAYKSRGFHM